MSQYLIWSNQHRAWWGANGVGYTCWIEEAGRYAEADAQRIVDDATAYGKLAHKVGSRLYGNDLFVVDEVMVPAPEDRPARVEDAQPGEADSVAVASAAGAPAATGAPAQDPDAPPHASPFAYRAERRCEP